MSRARLLFVSHPHPRISFSPHKTENHHVPRKVIVVDYPIMDSKCGYVGELNVAVRRPSPMARVLENLGEECYSPANSEQRSVGVSIASSVTSSVARTIVDGVQHTIAHWKVLLFGQLISFFLAAAGAASEELNGKCNVSVPLTQTTLVGFLLMLLGACKMKGWGSGRLHIGQPNETNRDNCEEEEGESFCSPTFDQNKEEHEGGSRFSFRLKKSPQEKSRSQPRAFCFGLQTIHAPLWLYFIVALVAVEARYLIFLSFRFTSFTFIYLVDALAIPSAILFSRLLLKRDYHFEHLLGGFICISGVVTNTISDLNVNTVEQNGYREDVNSGKNYFWFIVIILLVPYLTDLIIVTSQSNIYMGILSQLEGQFCWDWMMSCQRC